MFTFLVLICGIIDLCKGEVPPFAAVSEYKCGDITPEVFDCLNFPKLLDVKEHINKECIKGETPCIRMTCLFQNLQWSDSGGVVNKQRMKQFLYMVGTKYPEWVSAVDLVNTNCLPDRDLPPQGTYLGCPAYDVHLCFIYTVIQNAGPQLWRQDGNCTRHRWFASNCAVCPTECRAGAAPPGTCNACNVIPKPH